MYWQTSLIVLLLLCGFIALSWALNRHFRWLKTFNLVLISMLIAVSLILTNVIGYSRILFGKQIELGNFLIFVIGMLFGAWAGFIAGFISDLVGSLIFLGGVFHIGFMVAKIAFGLAGAFVFGNFLKPWWRLKLLFFVALAILLQLFIIHPLALYGTMVEDWPSLWARFIISLPSKFITLLIEIIAYPLLVFTSFRLLYFLCERTSRVHLLWSSRYQPVDFSWPKIKVKGLKKLSLRKVTNDV